MVRNAIVFSLVILTVQLGAAITYQEDVYGRGRRKIKHLEILLLGHDCEMFDDYRMSTKPLLRYMIKYVT